MPDVGMIPEPVTVDAQSSSKRKPLWRLVLNTEVSVVYLEIIGKVLH